MKDREPQTAKLPLFLPELSAQEGPCGMTVCVRLPEPVRTGVCGGGKSFGLAKGGSKTIIALVDKRKF